MGQPIGALAGTTRRSQPVIAIAVGADHPRGVPPCERQEGTRAEPGPEWARYVGRQSPDLDGVGIRRVDPVQDRGCQGREFHDRGPLDEGDLLVGRIILRVGPPWIARQVLAEGFQSDIGVGEDLPEQAALGQPVIRIGGHPGRVGVIEHLAMQARFGRKRWAEGQPCGGDPVDADPQFRNQGHLEVGFGIAVARDREAVGRFEILERNPGLARRIVAQAEIELVEPDEGCFGGVDLPGGAARQFHIQLELAIDNDRDRTGHEHLDELPRRDQGLGLGAQGCCAQGIHHQFLGQVGRRVQGDLSLGETQTIQLHGHGNRRVELEGHCVTDLDVARKGQHLLLGIEFLVTGRDDDLHIDFQHGAPGIQEGTSGTVVAQGVDQGTNGDLVRSGCHVRAAEQDRSVRGALQGGDLAAGREFVMAEFDGGVGQAEDGLHAREGRRGLALPDLDPFGDAEGAAGKAAGVLIGAHDEQIVGTRTSRRVGRKGQGAVPPTRSRGTDR